MVPVFTPVQAVAVVAVFAVILLMRFTVTFKLLLHPEEASVTVTVWLPAATLVNV